MTATAKNQEVKIVRPAFVKTPEAVPVEQFVRPPRMSAEYDKAAVRPVVWRGRDSDIDGVCIWLLDRLREKHPHMSDGGVVSLLQSSARTPQIFFGCGENSALVMEYRVSPLDPIPTVREVFMRLRFTQDTETAKRKEIIEEGIRLYQLGAEWARSIKARKFVFGEDSDIPADRFYDVNNDAKKKAHYCLVFL